MEKQEKNYKLVSLEHSPRIELNALLNLTSCEISINELPPNISVPFVHSHQQNEEIYIILEGDGEIYIDGDEMKIKKGDVFRINPDGKRCIKAGNNGIKHICIQAKYGSLQQFTMEDGVILQTKPSWL